MNRKWNWHQRALGLAGGLLLGLFGLLGCGGGSGGSENAGEYYSHYHTKGWLQEHPGKTAGGLEACTKCHEMTLLKVGSGVPNCLTAGCHHQGTPGYADPVVHGVRAKQPVSASSGGGLVSCQICHGRDFSGGASASGCVSCHGVKAPHPPKPWRLTNASVFTHATADPSNAIVCAQCHYSGSPHNPAGHPDTPPPAGAQPGCYNGTLCHGANTASHAVPFLAGLVDSKGNGHLTVTATAFQSDCASCHAYSGTSPTASAPLCRQCHTLADPVATGTHAGTCRSCHAGTAGLPLGPGGTSFPSIAGAHAKHMNLPTEITCDSCHGGSGTGTTQHYTQANTRTGTPAAPASVAIDAVFKAKTGGNPVFSAGSFTCAAVSCHGGQTTPEWQHGTLDAGSQCSACHGVAASAGVTTQYNDAFGRHSQGAHDATNPTNQIACATCHDMGNGSPGALAHFKYLHTQAVDGVATGIPADQLPSGTLVFDPAIVTGARTYTVNPGTQGNGGCAMTCHSHIHTTVINTWTASGASHPVPFLGGQTDNQGNGHLNATQAIFTADCGTCHAQSGTSPNGEAPACAICHSLADPTQVATGTGTCLSCHNGPSGLPDGPTGSTYPSIAGAHARHMALPTAMTCATCHNGSGTGTATHYNNANARITAPTGPGTVSILATFNAQSGGAASFAPASLTCSATSCHGGKTTPNWRTGTIASSTQCALCHAVNGGTGTTQYNDAVGRHAWGTHAGASSVDCTICHDMGATNTAPGVLNHFKYLDTTAVSGVATGSPADQMPSGTIRFKLTHATYPITGAATYGIGAGRPEGDGGCTLTCHSQNHLPADYHWDAPQGSGVSHPVPYLSTGVSTAGYRHQTLTLTQFNAECVNCHDESGSSAKTGPVCTVCHTLGSPLSSGRGAGTCLSCHVGAAFTTQGPTGTAWPNLRGSHPKHLALSTFTRTAPALPGSLLVSAYPKCEACHVGSVPGDAPQTHYANANKRATVPVSGGPAPVSIAAAFNAKSGTAGTTPSTSAFTCSNISCHGGHTTPGWQSGTIPVNATTYCTSCHTYGANQYNAPTGRHNDPNDHQQTCDTCHDMTQTRAGAQNHFKYLDTTAVSGVSGTPSDQYPSDTILFNSTVTGAKSYVVTPSTQGRGGCALTCHGETHASGSETWN